MTTLLFEARRQAAATSVWRRKMSERFPGDVRNALASQLLSRLALADDSTVSQATLDALQQYEHLAVMHEALQYETRRVGFASSPASLDEFLSDVLRYIRAVDVPTAGASLANVLPTAAVAR